MASGNLLFQAFVYLLATVIAVPVAKRLGLGSVLGYLLAGCVIGPFGLHLVAHGEHDIMHFAEFGVVMMLFVIGLELKPALLWELRGSILGLGGAQVAATAALTAVVALAFGLSGREGIAVGLIVAMSSTAIVLQSLQEKRLLKTPGGQSCFSVLLFQDIAVIPILALLPLLAPEGIAAPLARTGIAGLPGWQQALATLGAVAGIVLAGRFLLRHFFRFIAGSQLREVFTATALVLIVGIALLMQWVGLSPALGAFLAGMVLAESEYRHQLEADIEPFKGLLLGLFFISVGTSLDFLLIRQQPGLVALLVALLVGGKFLVLLALGRGFRLETSDGLLFAFALAQGGEFAFVLLALATQQSVLSPAVTNLLTAAIAVSMAFTPVLLIIYEKVMLPRFVRREARREADEITEHDNPVILAGFGRFGHVVGRLLRASGFGVTVLDNDADWVEALRNFGMKSFYGDASRKDLLLTAGARQARLFICAIDDEAKALEVVDLVRHEFSNLQILARAVSRQHAYELIRRGIQSVHRETLGSALDLSIDALRALGVSAGDAQHAAERFKELDNASVREMAAITETGDAYASRARQHIENLERTLRADRPSPLPATFTRVEDPPAPAPAD